MSNYFLVCVTPFLYLSSKLTKINQVQIQEQFIYQIGKQRRNVLEVEKLY